VLKGVFGYERLDLAHVVAKGRLQREETRLEALRDRRERIDQARERLDGARSVAGAALDRHRQLEAAAPEADRLGSEIRSAQADVESSDETVRQLEALVASLPPPEEVEAIVGAAEGADAAVAETERIRDEAAASRASVEATLADVRARLGDRERFRSFERLVEQMEREIEERGRAIAERQAREEERAAATVATGEALAAAQETAAALTTTEAEVTTAAAAVAAAREALTQAQHEEMAHELRGALSVGEPCPVCAQPVSTLPRKTAAPRSAAARKADGAAARAEAAARARKDEAAARAARADAGVTAAREREAVAAGAAVRAADAQSSAEAALAATQSQLTEWLGLGEDPRQALEAREQELEAAESAAEEAKAVVDRAREAVERAREEAARVREELATAANKLAGAWGRLGEEHDVRSEPMAVRDAFAELAASITTRHEGARAAREAASTRAARATSSLAEIIAGLDLPAGTDLVRALAQAQADHASAATVVDELERQVSEADDVERDILGAERARDLVNRLAEDLKPSRFLGFLLSEERIELAELGSAHFEDLTDGAYRFSDDDTFAIVDMNAASNVRKADSLSGGETFLASLALALALAEMVARGGGRLDSFFLDEGFGSLDPEHLDRAMDGIARLVAGDSDRLVVLVSHVDQMRETLEDLIVLDKDPRTGDTIVRSGASVAV